MRKRNFCLSRNRLCQKCLSCSRRSYKKRSFRKFRSDPTVFSRIMKEINDFLKRFFRFIFSCHIPERHSCFFFHVHLRIALSNAHHSAALIHALHHICEQPHHEQKRQDHRDKHFKKQLTDRIRNLTLKLNPGTVKFCHKRIIVNISRIKIRRVFFPFFFTEGSWIRNLSIASSNGLRRPSFSAFSTAFSRASSRALSVNVI